MKVHLIHTPEYSISQVLSVQELLSAHNGPLLFIASDYTFTTDQFPILKKYWQEFRFPS